ncbi:MAG: ATP-dependent sacrificial sulfur transferase LarE [Candidatus Bathyarchaeia archaeon]
MPSLDKKFSKLRDFISEKGRDGAVISFSGGVDSSTLALICRQILNKKAVAVTAISPTYPSEEVKQARKLAREIGIRHILIETHELLNGDFVRNPENRCYYCKKELLSKLQKVADELKFRTIFEGTNYSDLKGHRPGFKAVKELERVYSPWVEARFTKGDIRMLAKKLHLSIADKPSSACLASRISFNERITVERLKRVEKAEQAIRRITGVRQLRVRDHKGLARIEIEKEAINSLFDIRIINRITKDLKKLGFNFVTLDLEGFRTGSMLRILENL